MARKGKPYLTTGEVAEICDVTKVTAANWIRSGKLRAYRPPRGWYRIRPRDLFDFLAAGGMPIPEGLQTHGKDRRTHVLVVDDEPSFARLAIRALRGRADRYEVHTAASGFEAGRKVGEQTPDAVLLDLHMPGIDGLEVLKSLKLSAPETPVVLVSGFLDDKARRRARAAGADACLAKPVEPDELVEALEGALARAVRKPKSRHRNNG
jgi:excisionase family DNA binding protein